MSAPALLWLVNSRELALALLQVFLILVVAFVLGRIAMRLKQPAVLGEILAGIVLGPTVFGSIAPALQSQIFPSAGEGASILHAIAYLGLIAFVFTAGLQVDLSCVRRRSRSTLLISVSGIILPFALGFGMVVLLPGLWGIPSGDMGIFALFMGTALSISALPVIARILIDLDLLKKELGALIITAATIDDIVGWSLFALILSILNTDASLGLNLGLTVGVLALTASIIYLESKNGSRPHSLILGILIDLAAIAMLVASILSEALGANGIIGAFLAGIVLSQRSKRRDLILKKTYPLVIFILAPIYFASIGLKANFTTNFDPAIVMLVFVVACAGKIFGAGLGAWASGIPKREALAVGFGLNARGAMEIVLASVALDHGLIDERIFVALVVMALATTVISGSMIQRLLMTKPFGEEFPRIGAVSAIHKRWPR